MEYVREPDAIYAQSFAEISRVKQLQVLPEAIRPLATRIVHACGMPEILADFRYSNDVVDAAKTAFALGADVYCDVDTLRYGVMERLLPSGCKLHCRISAPETANLAKANKMTRAAAQIDLWGERLKGQIVAIGNAPTTLFRLLELIDQGLPKPAVIVAFPVGFVGAAESKAELVRDARGVPYVTLLGKRGGTAMAQAAINALAGGLST
jgi:precorrin-8X/cobalt-precorrin-8 methylmutase